MKGMFKKGICLIGGGMLLAAEAGTAEARPLSVYGETLQRYYENEFRGNMERYRRSIDAAATREDAQKLVEAARKRVAAAYVFPAEKCDLAARVTGKTEYPEFTVEKVLFQSRKNFTVTANFYLPKKRDGKIPAVLFLAGHAVKGKADSSYVKIPTALARKGCAVLAIDPIHQGERQQFPADNDPGLCPAHNILNRQLLAIGESIADWRVWDGIRGIDYLLTRPEVDPARIGVNGNSGGGTLTAMVAANDDRVAAAAPACYITTYLCNVENELPVDGEQMPRGFLTDGGEMADLILAQAPRPVRILSQRADFFDVRGTDESYAMLKKIYTLLGAPENISIVHGPGGHGYGPELRCGAYDFFNTVFDLNSDGQEPAGVQPAYEQLRCLPEGGVSQLPGEKNLRDFVAERMAELKQQRAAHPKSSVEMRRALAQLLKVTPPENAPRYRVLRPYFPKPEGSTPLMRFSLETEPGLSVTLFATGDGGTFGIPAVLNDKIELYLPHLGCREEMPALPKIAGGARFGLDYRGVGETEPNGCDQWNHDFNAEYNYDYHYASLGVLLGRPMIGRRVHDVLAALKLLRENGAREITLRAAGYGMIPAIFAAVLSPEPVKLELDGTPTAYEEAGRCVVSPIPQSFVPEGILKVADLDELLKFCNQPSVTEENKMNEPIVNYEESKAGNLPLPSALTRPDGGRVATAVEWHNRRRLEILADFERIMYGKIPPRPQSCRIEMISEVPDALGGAATRREVRIHMAGPHGEHFIDVLWYLPNHVKGPVPAVVGINFQGNAACTEESGIRPTVNFKSEGAQPHRWQIPMLIANGIAVATACRNDLFPDRADGRADSIYKMFHATGELGESNRDLTAISAWAFGCSRLFDLLETEARIDRQRIWVHGHSRLGKTALWAAANDPRFAGAVSNDSGCCGAALDRRNFGETIAKITATFPWWFPAELDNYAADPGKLPFDQHMLLGLIAPRPVLVASATEDLWADPRGEFLSTLNVTEVYQLFGSNGIAGSEFPAPEAPVFGDRVGYYLRTGKHDVTATDWKFVLEFMRRSAN